MKRIDLKSLSFGVFIGAAAFATVAATTSTEPAAVEFKVVNGAIWEGHFQRNLNAAADEGWKLVESNTFTDRHAYAVMSRPKK